MSDKVIVLPSKEEMLQRLLKACDENHLKERFYPKLLKDAGTEKVAMGIVMMFVFAMNDYLTGMPAVAIRTFNMLVPKLIEAVANDEEVAKEAKVLFEQVLAKS